MNEELDPALQFFPDGYIDLYGAMGINPDANDEEIRRAYRKAALLYHPDKQRHKDAEARAASDARFQQIGYAYSVLSTPARRTRFDMTGRTDETMFEESMDWEAYFRELWTGEVNSDTLDEFKKKYQGSSDEREDIIDAYRTTKGNLIEMVDHIPYMSLRSDKERIESVVEAAIKAREIGRIKGWDKTRSSKSLLEKAVKREEAEEGEAMDMARELGVYEALFGDEAARVKSRANGQTKAHKRKKGSNMEEEEDISALQNVIAKRNQARGSQMDNLITKLEAEATAKGRHKAGKQDGRGGKHRINVIGEPTEEEFTRIQQEMAASRAKKAKIVKSGTTRPQDR